MFDALVPHIVFGFWVSEFFAGPRLKGVVPGVETGVDRKLLFYVYDDERALRQSDLAGLLDVNRVTVWRSVRQLGAAGLVTNEREGRHTFVRATRAGRTAVVRLVQEAVAELPD